MMKTKAYVDTTILVEALFKDGPRADAARALLGEYDNIDVPEYAHKELKIGAVSNYYWLYKKLKDTRKLSEVFDFLSQSRMRPYRVSTSQEMLAVITREFERMTESDDAVAQIAAGSLAAEVRFRIEEGWNRRNQIGKLVQELDCYENLDIDVDSEDLTIDPVQCRKGASCCLRGRLSARRADLDAAREACSKIPHKNEIKRRSDVLRKLAVHPGQSLNRHECRALGDAYFALECPSDADLISTNRGDIEPLTSALGKSFAAPK